MELDEITRRVKIRVAFLGFSNLKEFVKHLEDQGVERSYHFWRTLSKHSPLTHLTEAAKHLGVDTSVLIGIDGDFYDLLKESSTTGRISLTE